MLSPETRDLLSLLPRMAMPERPLPNLRVSLSLLTGIALHHSLLPLLHQTLSASTETGGASLPPEWIRRREDVLALNLTAQTALQRIADRFSGPPIILMQGAALLGTVYPDPSLRPLSDVDLQVPAKARPEFERALAAEGFARDPSYRSLFHKGRLTLDVHCDLIGADRIRSRRFLFKHNPPIAEKLALIPSPLHPRLALLPSDAAFALDAIHAIKHSCSRWVWFVDSALRFSSRKPDFGEKVIAFAETHGCLASLQSYLRILDQAIPRLPLPERPAPGLFTRKIEQSLFPSLAFDWAGEIALWFAVAGPAGKFAYLFETAMPRPEILRAMAGPIPPPLPVLYGRRLLTLAGWLTSLLKRMNILSMKRSSDASLLCAGLILFSFANAQAYLDPGTGSYVIQVLAAMFLGGVFTVKIYWKRLKEFFRARFSGKKDNDDSSGG